jgi:hypothetical protein
VVSVRQQQQRVARTDTNRTRAGAGARVRTCERGGRSALPRRAEGLPVHDHVTNHCLSCQRAQLAHVRAVPRRVPARGRVPVVLCCTPSVHRRAGGAGASGPCCRCTHTRTHTRTHTHTHTHTHTFTHTHTHTHTHTRTIQRITPVGGARVSCANQQRCEACAPFRLATYVAFYKYAASYVAGCMLHAGDVVC